MQLAAKLPLSRFLLRSAEDAQQALTDAGGVLLPDLGMDVLDPRFGKIARHFAILGNVLDETTAIPEIKDVICPLLALPENEATKQRLEQRRLRYTPVSKVIVERLIPALQTIRVHVPWTFRAMNMDLSGRVSTWTKTHPQPWVAYYSQQIKLHIGDDPRRGLVDLGRLHSLSVEGPMQGTWHQPIERDLVDVEVALLIEANVLG